MSLHSREAEQSIIGACLLDNKLIDKASDLLTHRDFASIDNAVIWASMVMLRNAGKDADVVTVSERLERDETYEGVGGISYLAEITRNTPSTANAMTYAGIVADLAARRRLLDELSEVEAQAKDKGNEFHLVIDDAQGRLSRLVRADADKAGPMSDDLADMLDEIDRKWNGEQDAMGLSFGLTDLDSKTMGMHPGQLILVGGRPGAGKTAFALNILRACCVRDGKPALIFSMEMDRKSLRNRMTAAIGDLPLNAIRDPRKHMTDELWPRLTPAVHALNTAPLIVDDRAAMSPSQIRGSAKRWRDRYGDLGIIMVDYLQLMGNDKSGSRDANREQQVAEISRAMKLLAKEMQCPVVALSQLNRSLESRSDKRPMMSDLRESGALEQDADLILFLYRDEYYDENSPYKGVGEIIVGKQREGETGTVYAAANLAHARFADLDHQEIQRARALSMPQPKARKSAMAEI